MSRDSLLFITELAIESSLRRVQVVAFNFTVRLIGGDRYGAGLAYCRIAHQRGGQT
jgi:hypothetical protein